MAIENKISALVKNQFPDFYKEEGENFLAFIKAYYEYMEQQGKLTHEIRNLESYRDISTTTDDYIQYFFNTLLPSVPPNVLADKKIMAKYIKQFNTSRGTLDSYKLMFRAIYNEDVELYYPADSILKVSDGDWRFDRYLVTSYDPATYKFIGKTIKATESGAEALVEDVVRRIIRGRDLMQILVSNVKGDFNHLEPIRLKTDISGTGHAPIVEAGINRVTIETAGGEYAPGDVVSLISDDIGEFAKVVVTNTVDFGGALTFALVNGGSGYTPSIDGSVGSTEIELIGGDATEQASFQILRSDITDTFALSTNVTLLQSNNLFGSLGPTIGGTQISQLDDTIISQADYGFPEAGQQVTGGSNYRDHANAYIVLANTSNPGVIVGDSLYGVSSGANATVTFIRRAYNSTDVVLRVDGYRNFTTSEKVNVDTTDGVTVGTVSAFYGNTIGYHVAEVGWIANTAISPPLVGDELVGLSSGSFGVVKDVVKITANGYSRGVGGADDRDLCTLIITANTTANLTSQFDVGPFPGFLENEGLRLVGSGAAVGNVVSTTSNTLHENVYSKLSDALVFETSVFGTINRLSNILGGSGYSVAPTVRVRENDIASLGIGESYLYLQTDDVNWSTGNSVITSIDSNDRILQANTGASGDVKSVTIVAAPYANGTYELKVRVWQDFNQRDPGNIRFANNMGVTINVYDSSYVPGELDSRTPVDYGQAKIVAVDDRGVLGKNAVINAGVGSNGTITALRTLDSGFSYKQGERVRIEATNRPLAVGATGILTLQGVANSEGYYGTTRSHISSARGYIQDSRYYQEFSYELISPISIARYRDIALKLCHPAGQALFGKYRAQSNATLDISANTAKTRMAQSNGTISITKPKASGTISITNNTWDITGSSTALDDQFANNDFIIIETDPGAGLTNQFWKVKLATVTDATTANLNAKWVYGAVSAANIYYANTETAHNIVGSSTTLTSEFANGDVLFIEVDHKQYQRLVLNRVNSATSANLVAHWTQPDVSGANAYYITGSF